MKKLSKQYANPWYMAIVSGMTLVYVITLFLQGMTYKKTATNVAGENYVSEVTKWPGHTHVVNIPVEYE